MSNAADSLGAADPLLDCIDCGGRCHPLVNWSPDNPPQPGDLVTYRCEDCNDRWEIIVPDWPAADAT